MQGLATLHYTHYIGGFMTTYAENDFIATPNPTLNAEHWELQYPPINTNSPWLVNKFTGEIFPNTPEFARRSDCLEPYLGELPRDGAGEVVTDVNNALKHAETADGEMAEL